MLKKALLLTFIAATACASDVINRQIDTITTSSGTVFPVSDGATKTYVGANFLNLTGGTLSGSLNLGSHAITSLLDPINPQDAATKNYVDGHGALPPPIQALSAYTTETWGGQGSFLGQNSDLDQTFQLIGMGSSDTAVLNNFTSSVLLQSGSVTNSAVGNTGWSGAMYVQSGDVVGGTGNSGNLNLKTGSILGLGTGGAGSITLQTGSLQTGTPGNIVLMSQNNGSGTRGYVQIWANHLDMNNAPITNMTTATFLSGGQINFPDTSGSINMSGSTLNMGGGTINHPLLASTPMLGSNLDANGFGITGLGFLAMPLGGSPPVCNLAADGYLYDVWGGGTTQDIPQICEEGPGATFAWTPLGGGGALPSPLTDGTNVTLNQGGPGSFLGVTSDSDQTNLLLFLGSSDTASLVNSTSNVTVMTGDVTGVGSSGSAGVATLAAGNVVNGSGSGGNAVITAGGVTTGTGLGGVVRIDAGNADAGNGGPLNIDSGNSNTGNGGDVSIGTGASNSGSPGNIIIAPGSSSGFMGSVIPATDNTVNLGSVFPGGLNFATLNVDKIESESTGALTFSFSQTTTSVKVSPSNYLFNASFIAFPINTPITFTSSGTLPGGLLAATPYYVSAPVAGTASHRSLSLTPNGPVVPISSVGTGTLTVHYTGPTSQGIAFASNIDSSGLYSLGAWSQLDTPLITNSSGALAFNTGNNSAVEVNTIFGSGTPVAFQVNPTVTGTTGYTALLVNPLGAAGTGPNLLLDVQVAGADKFVVDTSGNLNLTGHLKNTVTTSPTAAVQAAAGTSATCTLDADSTDMVGGFTITTGGIGVGVGSFCNITFHNAYTHAPRCFFQATNEPAVAAQFWATSTTTVLSINGDSDPAATTYSMSYYCLENGI